MPKSILPKIFSTEVKPLHIVAQQEMDGVKLYDDLLEIICNRDNIITKIVSIVSQISLEPEGLEDIQKKALFAIMQVTNSALNERMITEQKALEIKSILIKKLPALMFYSGLGLDDLKSLKELGVNINYECFGLNLLTASRSFETFKFLVDNGCNINASNQVDGTGTALHVYITNENFKDSLKIVQTFGERLDLSIRDIQQKTVLITAAKVRGTAVIRALCALGRIRDIINFQDEDGRTALHYACILGMPEAVSILLTNGANLDIIDKNDQLPEQALSLDAARTRVVLESIEIAPDRAENATQNALNDLEPRLETIEKNGNAILATKANAAFYSKAKRNSGPQNAALKLFEQILSATSLVDSILKQRATIQAIITHHSTLLPSSTAIASILPSSSSSSKPSLDIASGVTIPPPHNACNTSNTPAAQNPGLQAEATSSMISYCYLLYTQHNLPSGVKDIFSSSLTPQI